MLQYSALPFPSGKYYTCNQRSEAIVRSHTNFGNDKNIIEYLDKCWKEVSKITDYSNPYVPLEVRMGIMFDAQGALAFMVRQCRIDTDQTPIYEKCFDAALKLPCIGEKPAVKAHVEKCKALYAVPNPTFSPDMNRYGKL